MLHLEKWTPDGKVFRKEMVDKQVVENFYKDDIPIHKVNTGT